MSKFLESQRESKFLRSFLRPRQIQDFWWAGPKTKMLLYSCTGTCACPSSTTANQKHLPHHELFRFPKFKWPLDPGLKGASRHISIVYKCKGLTHQLAGFNSKAAFFSQLQASPRFHLQLRNKHLCFDPRRDSMT